MPPALPKKAQATKLGQIQGADLPPLIIDAAEGPFQDGSGRIHLPLDRIIILQGNPVRMQVQRQTDDHQSPSAIPCS